jgi:hypothetical protein
LDAVEVAWFESDDELEAELNALIEDVMGESWEQDGRGEVWAY